MNRRELLISAALSISKSDGANRAAGIPIIDTHIHLFDGRRPQGAPYKGSAEYRGGVALPSTYRALAEPLGIVGAVILEASNWIEDNLWILEQAATDSMLVGVIGNLEPEKPEFAEYFERYCKNPLFRGIRCGNIWGRNLANQIGNRLFIDGLKRVAAADRVMDSANPDIELLQAIIRLHDKIPNLRIVIDHLPQLDPTPQNQAAYDAALKEIGARGTIYAKLSEIDHRGQRAAGLSAHRDRLDQLMSVFGEDRVVFGTDWPNSWGIATPAQIVALVRQYFSTRSSAAAEKYFWRNSCNVYKWVRRAPNQPKCS
jgi:L-fuconolactonase